MILTVKMNVDVLNVHKAAAFQGWWMRADGITGTEIKYKMSHLSQFLLKPN